MFQQITIKRSVCRVTWHLMFGDKIIDTASTKASAEQKQEHYQKLLSGIAA